MHGMASSLVFHYLSIYSSILYYNFVLGKCLMRWFIVINYDYHRYSGTNILNTSNQQKNIKVMLIMERYPLETY